ncbi:LPXTG cell wall anchor domain-containing protein [Bacillus cereus group sp. MYBK79-1]|uniref:LPXTG cell wall anchor domain-containing protein n=1 Tax=unclassified Bacillus cereus group TaxID=2750818 RepID=UPI003F7AF253
MAKKCMFTMMLIGMLVSMFSCYEKVAADSMNSKAGITFSNSYTPVTITDSIIPDGTTVVVDISDDRMKKKKLPKTGGYSSNLFQYLGVSSIVVAFALLLTLSRSENRKNRNESFYFNR